MATEAKVAAPAVAKAQKPAAGKWLVLPDTSIALQTYESTDRNLLDNLRELAKHSDHLITTPALRDEFLRRRQAVMQKLVPVLETKSTLPIPHFASKWAESRKFQEAQKKMKEAAKAIEDATEALLTKWRSAMEDHEQDEVWKVVRLIADHHGDLALTSANPEYDMHVERARERLELGNPPQKTRGDALGDSLNWEWSLTVCAVQKANLLILTKDGDYGNVKRGDDYMPNSFLMDEFHRRVGGDRQLIVTSHTTRALEIVGEQVTEKQKQEEAKALEDIHRYRLSEFWVPLSRMPLMNSKELMANALGLAGSDAPLAALGTLTSQDLVTRAFGLSSADYLRVVSGSAAADYLREVQEHVGQGIPDGTRVASGGKKTDKPPNAAS
jgi:hypothetical protein